MAVKFIFGRLKSILLFIWSLLRRAMCCLRRRRRLSDTPIPLTLSTATSSTAALREQGGSADGSKWESWDDQPLTIITEKVSTIQQHIENYRISQQKEDEPPPPDPDYFQDLGLIPRISKPSNVVIRTEEDRRDEGGSSRLALASDAVLYPNAELIEWDENSSWEASQEGLWDGDAALEEQRRQERLKRQQEHQRRKQERELQRSSSLNKPGVLGTRLR